MIEESFDVGGEPLPLVRSALIPARFHHGFTTRRGGVSAPPFDTLNLGMKWGDARAHVIENRRRLQVATGVERIFVARQVHGANVLQVNGGDVPADVAQIEADGLFSDAPGIAIGVYVADCIPVLMADARTGAFAAVHAGWRGTLAGVVPAAVRRMVDELGARPEDLRIALGPAIGVCCFEVGDEVVDAVARAMPRAMAPAARAIQRAANGRAHVDLKRLNVMLLEAEGVPASAIDAGPECTSCDRARFFSYRRDKGETGQAIGFILAAETKPEE
jgi:YfiH family protein